MRRNLILLDLLLLALIAAVSWQLWNGYKDRAVRQQAFLTAPAPAAPPALVSIPPAPGQVSASNYYEVASVLPFSKDRNPTVIVDVVAPKPVPAFPRYYGMMNWGGGPKVILSPNPGGAQKSYVVGDKVGDFKLVSIAQAGLVFEWEGKQLPAKYEEMRDSGGGSQQATNSGGGQSAASSTASVVNVTAPGSSGGDSPVKSVTSTVVSVIGGDVRRPGPDVGAGIRGCQPGDPTPAGVIVDGYRKLVTETPFGKSCRWERAQ
ncbi:hypothetical protein [Paludibaculum fermentans]|uniref:Uncharacterized protein n=1 Tax=Paludibaculum fermentans TaxID=1473598 RepID=A0A7S7NMV7_PALFE|nr:hypothetical protein [Paludibaculum fermentans]QOY86533.1 hypothetical protein IRI77_27590 [Paludibaculum fermentans]